MIKPSKNQSAEQSALCHFATMVLETDYSTNPYQVATKLCHLCPGVYENMRSLYHKIKYIKPSKDYLGLDTRSTIDFSDSKV